MTSYHYKIEKEAVIEINMIWMYGGMNGSTTGQHGGPCCRLISAVNFNTADYFTSYLSAICFTFN
jgi:hypothetical protein